MPWGPAQFMPPPPMMMGMNMGPQFLPPQQNMQGPAAPPGAFGGACYKCGQPGHMARNCPGMMRMNTPQNNGGGNGGGRKPFRPYKKGKKG